MRSKALSMPVLMFSLLSFVVMPGAYATGKSSDDKAVQLALIHIGDIHGHLIPRPHLRSDGDGQLQGGLARMFTKIEKIREQHRYSLLINTGDTIQGSAEALYTEGQALVDVLNRFDIDYFAPGNWEFVYGTERFQGLFAGKEPVAPWHALAANLYFDGEPYADKTGERVLPPYTIKQIDGIRVGILGFTTERGPKVVGNEVVQGFRFTKGDAEMAEFVSLLRPQVDVLVVISELGLANNIRLAEANPGIDVVLSSDMHEETLEPVVTSNGTLIVEEGQDGTRVGELVLTVVKGKVVERDFTMHTIDTDIPEHKAIAKKVAQVRESFVAGPGFEPHLNPISGTVLKTPIDTIIGYADIPLHRSNFSHEDMPAVIEGSSHDFLTDVFRTMTGADLGVIRGFRYGTHIAPGPIKLEDIYHYIAIGPFIAKGEVTGQLIKNVLENSADGSLNPDVTQWRGGWLFGWAGIKFDLYPNAAHGQRAQNIMVQDAVTQMWAPLDLNAIYTLGGYNYASEPTLINKIPAKNVQVYSDAAGFPVEGTEVVAEYLKTRTANPELNRIRLMAPLPEPLYDNPEIQPLHGVPTYIIN